MAKSIVNKLVQNDLKINQTPILMWSLAALIGILIAFFIPGLVAANIGFTLILSAIVGAGIQLMTNTILHDNLKGTQVFIMSLPLSFKHYTTAKLIVNKFVFLLMWIVLSAACLFIAFSRGLFPMGSLPMMTMILMSILPAYSVILATCVKTQSIGITIVSTISISVITSAYLWVIVGLDSVGTFVWGDQAVWNSTVFSIIAVQIIISVIIMILTVVVQFRKKDFI